MTKVLPRGTLHFGMIALAIANSFVSILADIM